MTVCGRVRLTRRHDRCACGWSGYLADDYLGLDGPLSAGALRLACLSANGSSFAVAARHLQEYCGLDLSVDMVRRHCEREAKAIGVWLDTQEVVAELFAEAEGEPEFQTDAGKVNTTKGWKDLKVASFAKRPLAAPAEPEEWKTRSLPKPTAQVLFAAVAPIEEFIPLVEKQLDHLATTAASASAAPVDPIVTAPALPAPAFEGEWAWGSEEPVHCLGDGASWIWRASQELFEHPRETLDFYHGTDAISKYTRRQYGEETETKKARYERGVTLLLTAGDAGIRQFLEEERHLLQAERKASVNELSASTMLATMLLTSSLTLPMLPVQAEVKADAHADAKAEAHADGTAPKAMSTPTAREAVSFPKALPNASDVPSELDEDDLEGIELQNALKSKIPQQRIDGLGRYFAKHASRLNYADRLREGRAIGSGMIEGNIKTITLRLKARGARWLLPNVVAMSRLCCLCNGTMWADYWQSA